MEGVREYALIWSLHGLALLLILGRIQSRIAIREMLKIDDYLSILSFFFLTIQTVLHTLTVQPYFEAESVFHSNLKKAGALTADPSLEGSTSTVLRYSFASLVIFWLAVWSVKFSMLFFFRRFLLPIPSYMEGWYIVFGFTIMNLLGCLLIQFLGCLPFEDNFSITSGTCVLGQSRELGKLAGTTALDIVSDVMIIILPTRILFELHATKKQKAGLVAVFALGWIVIAIALIRAIHASLAGRNHLGAIDSSWLWIWSQVECVAAVSVACLPPIWAGYKKKKNQTVQPATLITI